MRKKKALSLLLAVAACAALTTSAFAFEPTVVNINPPEIQLRSNIETVRYYCYLLEDYDGTVSTTPWAYKDIIIPEGKVLVCTNDCKAVSVKYDAYYNNVKYASVARIECVYELQ